MADDVLTKTKHWRTPFKCQGEVNEVMHASMEKWADASTVRALANEAKEAGPSGLKMDPFKEQLVRHTRHVVRGASTYVYNGLLDKSIEMRVHTSSCLHIGGPTELRGDKQDGRVVVYTYRTRRRRAHGVRPSLPFESTDRPPAKEEGGGWGRRPLNPTNKPASNLIIHCFFAVCLLVLVAFVRLPTALGFHHGPSFPRPFPSSSSPSSSRPRTLSPSLPPSFCQACMDNNDKIINFFISHQKVNRKNKSMRIKQQRHQHQPGMSKRRRSHFGDDNFPALTLPVPPPPPPPPSYLASMINNNDNDKVENDCGDESEGTGEKEQDLSAIFLINFLSGYRRFISPLLPQACRFFPTCSEYAIESIQTFGAAKGLVLTVWRLVRCNPLGGKGWDPPQWPPPGWFAGGTGRKGGRKGGRDG